MISASMFAKRPVHDPRYRPGDVVKTTKKTRGTLSRYDQQVPLDIPAGMHGSISEVAPFRPSEDFPPRWIYRVRFPGTGETRYWIRGSNLRLVQRNPKINRTIKRVKNRRK